MSETTWNDFLEAHRSAEVDRELLIVVGHTGWARSKHFEPILPVHPPSTDPQSIYEPAA